MLITSVFLSLLRLIHTLALCRGTCLCISTSCDWRPLMNSASSLKSLVSSLRINLASKMTSSSSPIQLIDITIKVTT